MKLVLASGNAGKLAELRDVPGKDGHDLHAQSEFGVDDVEETGLSFVENALLRPATRRLSPGCRRWPTTRACAWTRSAARQGCTRPATPVGTAMRRRTSTSCSTR